MVKPVKKLSPISKICTDRTDNTGFDSSVSSVFKVVENSDGSGFNSENPESLILNYGLRFINRWDCYNEQQSDGSYLCVRKRISLTTIWEHLTCKRVIGFFALSASNTARWICWDFDGQGKLAQLKTFLNRNGWHTIHVSGRPDRDGHLYCLFDEPLAGGEAKQFGEYMLYQAGIRAEKKLGGALDIELFPKQPIAENVGSAVRAPLGINLKLDAHGCIYRFEGTQSELAKQLQWLSDQPLNRASAIQRIAEFARASNRNTFAVRRDKPPSKLISALDLSKLLNAKKRGNGWIANCPAHIDKIPSLSFIDLEGKLLINCFAGCSFERIMSVIKNGSSPTD